MCKFLHGLFLFTAMPFLINHVHKNSMGLNRLINSFLDFWRKRQPENDILTPDSYPQISKRQLERKILEIAKRNTLPDSGKSCYYVHQSLLGKYEMELEQTKDIHIPADTKNTSPKSHNPTSTKNVFVGFKPCDKNTVDSKNVTKSVLLKDGGQFSAATELGGIKKKEVILIS